MIIVKIASQIQKKNKQLLVLGGMLTMLLGLATPAHGFWGRMRQAYTGLASRFSRNTGRAVFGGAATLGVVGLCAMPESLKRSDFTAPRPQSLNMPSRILAAKIILENGSLDWEHGLFSHSRFSERDAKGWGYGKNGLAMATFEKGEEAVEYHTYGTDLEAKKLEFGHKAARRSHEKPQLLLTIGDQEEPIIFNAEPKYRKAFKEPASKEFPDGEYHVIGKVRIALEGRGEEEISFTSTYPSIWSCKRSYLRDKENGEIALLTERDYMQNCMAQDPLVVLLRSKIK